MKLEGLSKKPPLVDCKCPTCKKVHQVRMHWIGSGKPWKYCPVCAGKAAAVYTY